MHVIGAALIWEMVIRNHALSNSQPKLSYATA